MSAWRKAACTGPGPADGAHPIGYLCRNLREEENQALTHALHDRVRLLRSLSLEIGAEVRYQNRSLLGTLDDDLERADGMLDKAMSRVARVVRAPQHYYVVVVFLFSVACFASVWCFVRFR
ncbi:hypothetical protein ONE63_007465 [Megalurothrips usitatus]|uniref:t-SNARE coiled-coil homology domain-containing protein n=1 Tax=Megalurothrips usitatus TaxID=439358 RepID=A0AAV7XMU4_9NEOP|nr:hypothetical protein ONE63_007465 [Megalurothrips usitatus]